MFFGTPHQEANKDLSWPQIFKAIVSIHLYNGTLLPALDNDCKWLQLQLEQFKSAGAHIPVRCAYEEMVTEGGSYNAIVSPLKSFKVSNVEARDLGCSEIVRGSVLFKS